MIIDWNRVLRTLIQASAGAGVALITAITQDFSKGSIIASVIEFCGTVITALLMNIENQANREE